MVIKNRRLGCRPGTPVAASVWPGRLNGMVGGTWWQNLRSVDDTNTGWCCLALGWMNVGEKRRVWENDGENFSRRGRVTTPFPGDNAHRHEASLIPQRLEVILELPRFQVQWEQTPL